MEAGRFEDLGRPLNRRDCWKIGMLSRIRRIWKLRGNGARKMGWSLNRAKRKCKGEVRFVPPLQKESALNIVDKRTRDILSRVSCRQQKMGGDKLSSPLSARMEFYFYHSCLRLKSIILPRFRPNGFCGTSSMSFSIPWFGR